MSTLVELPYGLPGRVYRSPMPFSRFDPLQELFSCYLQNRIQAVVVLASDQEIQAKTGMDLRQLYRENGLAVIDCPIADFSLPSPTQLSAALQEAAFRLQAGETLAIHCFAGIGRTGLFAACLAKDLLHLDGTSAIVWVRSCLPGAVETPEQVRFVLDYSPAPAQETRR